MSGTLYQNTIDDSFFLQSKNIDLEVLGYYLYNKDVFRGKTVLCACDDPEWRGFCNCFIKNFEKFGLKKFIGISNVDTPKITGDYKNPLEQNSRRYNEKKSRTCGKIMEIDAHDAAIGNYDVDIMKWSYLKGTGDFQTLEVTAKRNQADFIFMNPMHKRFREALYWAMVDNKKFSICGSVNAVIYKETFPLFHDGKFWVGHTVGTKSYMKCDGTIKCINNTRWYTNIDVARRHIRLPLMTLYENIMSSSNSKIQENGYPKYDNYEAIEVSSVSAIPSDYDGVMGVPITFMDNYNPEQFEIVWIATGHAKRTMPTEARELTKFDANARSADYHTGGFAIIAGRQTYHRLLIRHIQ